MVKVYLLQQKKAKTLRSPSEDPVHAEYKAQSRIAKLDSDEAKGANL